MTSDPKLTNERLRQWLNTDQPSRERMCAAIMELDRRYSRVELRRPEGGPDGKRDIQAILDGTTFVWGAVGFQNNVSDSPEEKRQAMSKFRDDLIAAKSEKADLRAFVFFTNVDLTPGEVRELTEFASAHGIASPEIYWRERLRQALDSPAGFACRYQYLRIPLNEAEQASFFNNYGRQLQDLVASQHERLTQGVERLEFLHWMSRPLFELRLVLRGRRRLKAEGIDHFHAMARISSVPQTSDNGWWIGGCDDRLLNEGKPDMRSVSEKVFFRSNDATALAEVKGTKVFLPDIFDLRFGVSFNRGWSLTPEWLERFVVDLYISPNLTEFVDASEIVVNGYVIERRKSFRWEPRKVELPWPGKPENKKMDWLGDASFRHWIDFARTAEKASP